MLRQNQQSFEEDITNLLIINLLRQSIDTLQAMTERLRSQYEHTARIKARSLYSLPALKDAMPSEPA